MMKIGPATRFAQWTSSARRVSIANRMSDRSSLTRKGGAWRCLGEERPGLREQILPPVEPETPLVDPSVVLDVADPVSQVS